LPQLVGITRSPGVGLRRSCIRDVDRLMGRSPLTAYACAHVSEHPPDIDQRRWRCDTATPRQPAWRTCCCPVPLFHPGPGTGQRLRAFDQVAALLVLVRRNGGRARCGRSTTTTISYPVNPLACCIIFPISTLRAGRARRSHIRLSGCPLHTVDAARISRDSVSVSDYCWGV